MPRAAVFAAAMLAGAPLLAQSPAAPEPRPERAGTYFFSAGTDALGKDFGTAAHGLSAHAGYERRIGGARSPFSLRVAGDYWRTGRSFMGDVQGVGPMNINRTTTMVGGSVLGVLQLPRLGAVRPYALAGVGLQQYNNRNEGDIIPTGVNTAWQAIYLSPVRVNAISYTAGLGASARLGPVTPFVEMRAMILPGLATMGLQQVRAPLTIGLRF